MTKVHLIGIGGSGLSAIARLLMESGETVTGSDRALSPEAQALIRDGVRVFTGHNARNVVGADLIVRSSAIPDDNPEVQAARNAGIPVLKRSDYLGQLMVDDKCIAVAGTHGKTTTTAMAAWTMHALGTDPSYIIGGISKDLGSNAHAGKGKFFVIEADEYDRMFLGLNPDIAIITNMEHDHPDCFPTPQDYRAAFASFVERLKPDGILLACADDAETTILAEQAADEHRVFTYGQSETAHYQVQDIQRNAAGGYDFVIVHRPQPGAAAAPLAKVSLSVPGIHNINNATACMAAMHQLGLSLTKAAVALHQFSGAGRRFDLRGTAAGITVIDDYAHHPTEIKATLEAARSRFQQRRFFVVWQPHTYTRTQTLQQEFIRALSSADQVIITEIYAAREKDTGFSSQQIVEKMPAGSTSYAPTLENAAEQLLQKLLPGDVLLVLSAGDAIHISETVFSALQEKERSNV
ncbi:MAG: UDP-N-acetylmuramate--L-alanine ligase [Anaerolineaceae bacterium]|nr:UDP-N-acetylmuramate--L-alanine ligase [Anaerolineaceae bacterium]